jgi:hypothetical protein
MGEGAESIPLLDAAMIQDYQRRVMQTGNRKDLDRLTRHIWNAFDHPTGKNTAGLAQLRAAIEARNYDGGGIPWI